MADDCLGWPIFVLLYADHNPEEEKRLHLGSNEAMGQLSKAPTQPLMTEDDDTRPDLTGP